MKILPQLFAKFKTPNYVQIGHYSYADENSVKTLWKLEKIKDIFVPYAKHENVSITIDKASTIAKEEKPLADKITETILSKTDDIKNYIGIKILDLKTMKKNIVFINNKNKDGINEESDFFRHVYQAVENLRKSLKGTNK